MFFGKTPAFTLKIRSPRKRKRERERKQKCNFVILYLTFTAHFLFTFSCTTTSVYRFFIYILLFLHFVYSLILFSISLSVYQTLNQDKFFSLFVNDNYNYFSFPFGYQFIYCLSAGRKSFLCVIFIAEVFISTLEVQNYNDYLNFIAIVMVILLGVIKPY